MIALPVCECGHEIAVHIWGRDSLHKSPDLRACYGGWYCPCAGFLTSSVRVLPPLYDWQRTGDL